MKKNIAKALCIILSIINIIAVGYMLFIYVWASSYTVYGGDEFADALGAGTFKAFFPIHLYSALRFMVLMYLNWQGTYSAMFLEALLNPINGFGLTQLRIVMAINTLLIMVSVLCLIYELFQHSSSTKKYLIPIISALTIFTLFGFSTYQEVFFWYAGSTPFGYPFSFMIFGLTFIFRSYRTGSKASATWAKLFGFLACGGTLMITGAGCYFALLIVTYYSLKEKKISINGIRMFLWWLSGALVNVIAPGNYIRQDSSSQKISLFEALNNSRIICIRELKCFIKTTGLFEIAVICVIIGIIIGLTAIKKQTKRDNLALFMITLLSPLSSWISCFPAVLGYGAGPGWDLNNRCNFVIETCFIFSVILFSIVLGYTCTDILKTKSTLVIPVLIAAIALWAFCFPVNLLQNKYFELNRQLVNGEIQGYYAECNTFYDNLDSYPDGSDVRFKMEDMPQPVPNTINIYSYEDPTNPGNWLNTAWATYYKLNSFALE